MSGMMLRSLGKFFPLAVVLLNSGQGGLDAQSSTPTPVQAQNSAGDRGEQKKVPEPPVSPIVTEAFKYIGTPYVWGGTGLTTGTDSSHFVTGVFEKAGHSLRLKTSKSGNGPSLRTQLETLGQIVHRKDKILRRGGKAVTTNAPTDLRVLRPGDRLIFQRGNTMAQGTFHTGIYIGRIPDTWKRRFGDIPWAFIHCSSSSGVTVSSLVQPYYWKLYRYALRDPAPMRPRTK
jgi:cell wall-associated NlpC family hydrolase